MVKVGTFQHSVNQSQIIFASRKLRVKTIVSSLAYLSAVSNDMLSHA